MAKTSFYLIKYYCHFGTLFCKPWAAPDLPKVKLWDSRSNSSQIPSSSFCLTISAQRREILINNESVLSWQRVTARICCCVMCCCDAWRLPLSISLSWPPGPQQQTHRSGMQWLIDRTDRRTPYHYTDPAASCVKNERANKRKYRQRWTVAWERVSHQQLKQLTSLAQDFQCVTAWACWPSVSLSHQPRYAVMPTDTAHTYTMSQ